MPRRRYGILDKMDVVVLGIVIGLAALVVSLAALAVALAAFWRGATAKQAQRLEAYYIRKDGYPPEELVDPQLAYHVMRTLSKVRQRSFPEAQKGYADLETLLREGLPGKAPELTELLVLVLCNNAALLLISNDLLPAWSKTREAVDICDRFGFDHQMPTAMQWHGHTRGVIGEYYGDPESLTEAVETVGRALARCPDARKATVRATLAKALTRAGRIQEAVDLVENDIPYAASLGDANLLAANLHQVGGIYTLMGDRPHLAEKCLIDAFDLAASPGVNPLVRVMSAVDLVCLYVAMGSDSLESAVQIASREARSRSAFHQFEQLRRALRPLEETAKYRDLLNHLN